MDACRVYMREHTHINTHVKAYQTITVIPENKRNMHFTTFVTISYVTSKIQIQIIKKLTHFTALMLYIYTLIISASKYNF